MRIKCDFPASSVYTATMKLSSTYDHRIVKTSFHTFLAVCRGTVSGHLISGLANLGQFAIPCSLFSPI
jgi:hypothetical protein